MSKSSVESELRCKLFSDNIVFVAFTVAAISAIQVDLVVVNVDTFFPIFLPIIIANSMTSIDISIHIVPLYFYSYHSYYYYPYP